MKFPLDIDTELERLKKWSADNGAVDSSALSDVYAIFFKLLNDAYEDGRQKGYTDGYKDGYKQLR